MCWVCDHPRASRQDWVDHLREMLAEQCWIVIYVRREKYRPPYSYTVGLTGHGKPEIVVTGLPEQRAGDLLNDVAAHFVHADPPPPGERVPLTSGPLIEIVRVAEPSAHLNVAVELYGPQVTALQLVYADDRGHWPWDRGFRGGRGGQPVLGARAGSRVS
jgi:Domain of unknown function (DUF4262)